MVLIGKISAMGRGRRSREGSVREREGRRPLPQSVLFYKVRKIKVEEGGGKELGGGGERGKRK